MKLRDLIRSIRVLGGSADLETEIGGVCYDSRAVKPGDLFVAVRGYAVDGHRFIPKALENGAAAVLCIDEQPESVPTVLTDNTRLALALVSREFFGDPASGMRMIGITGTNGKTTSSYLIKHMLEEALGAKVGLIGTNGIMIGEEFIHSERTTPESYELQKLFRQMADAGCTHVVMEVSSHALVLDRVAGIRFNTALYTNLTQDHLDFHGTMEAYAEAKRLLFSRCDAAAFNVDDAWADYMIAGAACPVLRCSAQGREAELSAENIALRADGVRYTAAYQGETAEVNAVLPGLFSVHNTLGVIGVGLLEGIPFAACAQAMNSARGVKGRMEVVPTDGDYSVIIDYSHTPDALENALRTLRPVTRGRLIALFGCGGDRDHAKRPIMGRIGAELADLCIVTSDNPRTEEPMAIIEDILAGMRESKTPREVICDRVAAIGWAIDNAGPGDVILLAGKGHEDYQEVGHEKRHMDEREIVADFLRRR